MEYWFLPSPYNRQAKLLDRIREVVSGDTVSFTFEAKVEGEAMTNLLSDLRITLSPAFAYDKPVWEGCWAVGVDRDDDWTNEALYRVTLPAQISASLAPGSFKVSCVLEDTGTGVVETCAEGTLIISSRPSGAIRRNMLEPWQRYCEQQDVEERTVNFNTGTKEIVLEVTDGEVLLTSMFKFDLPDNPSYTVFNVPAGFKVILRETAVQDGTLTYLVAINHA